MRFGVLAVFVGKDVLALEDGGVKACSPIGREAIPNNGFDLIADVHFRGAIVASSLFYCHIRVETVVQVDIPSQSLRVADPSSSLVAQFLIFHFPLFFFFLVLYFSRNPG